MTAAHAALLTVSGACLVFTACCAVATARQFHRPWWLRKPAPAAGDSVAQALTDAEQLTTPPDPWATWLDEHPELATLKERTR